MTDTLRITCPSYLRQVGHRACRATISSGQPGRDGLAIDVNGIDLSSYRRNPVVLLEHDRTKPIARCSPINRNGDALEGLIQFPDEGISPDADLAYGLVQARVLNACSIGFEPLATDPADRATGIRRVRSCILMETSLVAIPGDENALIFDRAWSGRRLPRDISGDRELILFGHEMLRAERLRKPAWDRSVDIGWFGRETARRAHKKFLAVYGL
jgi:HK97 family phage prohead protease